MSHTVVQQADQTMRWVTLTIQNYTVGGETVTAADVESDAASIVPIALGIVYPANNSLGTVLFPVIAAGKILLFRLVAGVPTEVPTTTALNAVMQCLIHLVMA